MGVVFLINGNGDLPAVDRRHAHEGMGRFREGRVIVVLAYRHGLSDVRYVDHPNPAVPAASPQSIALPQRMVEPMLSSGPGRFLAAREMLSRQPPARDFLRLRGLAAIVYDEHAPDIAFHLLGDTS